MPEKSWCHGKSWLNIKIWGNYPESLMRSMRRWMYSQEIWGFTIPFCTVLFKVISGLHTWHDVLGNFLIWVEFDDTLQKIIFPIVNCFIGRHGAYLFPRVRGKYTLHNHPIFVTLPLRFGVPKLEDANKAMVARVLGDVTFRRSCGKRSPPSYRMIRNNEHDPGLTLTC